MLKKNFLAFMDHFESYICQILLVFFVGIIFLQIILRATGDSLKWTEEIARYAFLWFILFGACYATRLAALNRVTMQFLKFPPIVGKVCLLLSDVIWLVFCLVMAWNGYLAVMDLAEFPYYTPALDWDLSKIFLVFPISFVLMAIRIVQVNVIKYVLHNEIVDPDQQAIEDSKQLLAEEGEEV
ncbi:MAG: TRAP transporter small permease [Desulfovibrio sp.]|jgi:TRAP-type C4-dicarboxylate transport system permease small subunit|nr:TRAP transporter small permease [Desulfovibrio sp.]